MSAKKISSCLNCNSEIEYLPSQQTGKYCNNKCQGEYEYSNVTLIRFSDGLITERHTLRKILKKEVSDTCNECGLKDWNGKEIVLQVDHIDGNAGNNFPDNLRLICPNCHSQTEHFGGRNKGNGRKSRGLPLR